MRGCTKISVTGQSPLLPHQLPQVYKVVHTIDTHISEKRYACTYEEYAQEITSEGSESTKISMVGMVKCLHESTDNVILEIAVCIPVACMAKPLVTLATVPYCTALLAVGTPPFSCF